jgi:hypothetical protein
MNSKPILFSGPMVRAILDGKKTQTRRVIKNIHPPYAEVDNWHNNGIAVHLTMDKYGDYHENLNPYGQPGDYLWVRETFRYGGDGEVLYRCDCSKYEQKEKGPWKPSIFMRRSASRILLKIKNIRVEKLQDISESDAKAEGVENINEYSQLWEDINGFASWQDNPWLWVIEFERAEGDKE